MRKLPGIGSRWVRRKKARPQELVAAALELFVEQGYARTRLEDIASRAGVSKPTLYLYFRSKEELFDAVVRGSILPITSGAKPLLTAFEGHSADLIGVAILQWWDRASAKNHSGVFRLITAEANNFPALARLYQAEVINPDMRLIEHILERGIARNEFRQVNVGLAAQVLMSTMLMLTMWTNLDCQGGPLDLDPLDFLESLVDLTVRGLSLSGNG